MAEHAWRAARLIPTSGIKGPVDQERRATSALLAVMSSVREFGRSILSPLGAPGGPIRTYTEVPFQLGEHKHRPDGLIRVTRGTNTWTALVEVKTGANCLEATQVQAYVDIARQEQFNTVLTISNEICPGHHSHPTPIDTSKLKNVTLRHLSWTEVLTHAVVQKEHRGVSDPEQAWILQELILYLQDQASGALEFSDMGPSWVTVREAVVAGTLQRRDKAAGELAERWDQLLRFACLRLGRTLGSEVQPVLSRQEAANPGARAQALVSSLAAHGRLDGVIRIPNTIGPIGVTADLRSGQVSATVVVDAPREGRDPARVNWLLRQLKEAPDTLRIETFALRSRGVTRSTQLRTARADPRCLVDEHRRDIRTFQLTYTGPMGTRRKGRGSFIESVLEVLDTFHETTVRKLRSWTPPASRRRSALETEPAADAEPSLLSLPSQDSLGPAATPNGTVPDLCLPDLCLPDLCLPDDRGGGGDAVADKGAKQAASATDEPSDLGTVVEVRPISTQPDRRLLAARALDQAS